MKKVITPAKTSQTAEFGDFQTPEPLAKEVVALLQRSGLYPASIIEPTCGKGNLLLASLRVWNDVQRVIGVEISTDYFATCNTAVSHHILDKKFSGNINLRCESFFDTDWASLLTDIPEPILVLGNPPWVTNAHLGSLGSTNLPEKTNFQSHVGLDALTGKSNFDISEWMLIRAMHWLHEREGVMAMLIKTTVARKLLLHAWKNNLTARYSAMYRIDAAQHFGAAVDACLFVVAFSPQTINHNCLVYDSMDENSIPVANIGWRDKEIVADINQYEQFKHLISDGSSSVYRWRSGIKHDCSKVMELERINGTNEYMNGLGESVVIEDTYLFPMLKTSEVAKRLTSTKRAMLVTQRNVGESTDSISDIAPKTWNYLQQHASLLDARGSVIYKKRPRFSIFGIGDYAFATWKVAISGFYKQLSFTVIRPERERPVVLDDASYFLACHTSEEAEFLADLLNSSTARKFYESFIFWDSKRPITVDLLKRLDIKKLAYELGRGDAFESHLSNKIRTQDTLRPELV